MSRAGTNYTDMIDVHQFDGKWKKEIKSSFTPQEKINLFSILKELTDCRRGLDLIIGSIQKAANYEPMSCLYADDILAEILRKSRKLDNKSRTKFFNLLSEQINDMYNLGRCPSGRVTRLIQIYNCLDE